MRQSIFISGAAQGIGRATALQLAREGWFVGAYDISPEVDQLRAPNLHTGHLDVTDPQSWETALADFAAAAGGIDVLVNNAGVLYGGKFIEAGSFDQDATLVDVNIKGVLFGSRAGFPHLKARPGSKLINLSSAASIYGTPEMAAYSTTKFAVRGLTEALEVEWAAEGVEVHSIVPLYAQTGMLDGVMTNGIRRMGVSLTAEDVAAAVVRVARADPGRGGGVHHPVGLKTTLMYALSQVTPARLMRFVNARLTSGTKVRF